MRGRCPEGGDSVKIHHICDLMPGVNVGLYHSKKVWLPVRMSLLRNEDPGVEEILLVKSKTLKRFSK